MSLGQAWVPNQNLTLVLELLLIKLFSVPRNLIICINLLLTFPKANSIELTHSYSPYPDAKHWGTVDKPQCGALLVKCVGHASSVSIQLID